MEYKYAEISIAYVDYSDIGKDAILGYSLT
jgi:hypothetical protein